MSRILYTVGHSNHSQADFQALLQAQGIKCLADIRSAPYSRRYPHFSRKELAAWLKTAGIDYVFMGEAFGARRSDPSLLDAQGQLDFERVRSTRAFKTGLERLQTMLTQTYGLALLCSEADPLQCHRVSMLCPALKALGIELVHLLRDGSLLDQAALEAKLLQTYASKLPTATLFEPEPTAEMQLASAYRLHNRDVAYSPEQQQRFMSP